MEKLKMAFSQAPDVKLGTGKSAGIGTPGEVPANYQPDKNNHLSTYRNVTGCDRNDIHDYKMFIDDWNWETYDYTKWPSADMSFPDLDENKKYDLWPFKPDLNQPHWSDLNNQIKSGVERKIFALGLEREFSTPKQYIGKEVQKLITEFEALLQEADEEKIQAAGFKNSEHLTYVIAISKTTLKKAYGEAQVQLDKVNEKLQGEMNANIDSAKKGGLLDPIGGVSMEDWAGANVKISGGMQLIEVLKVLGIEKPVWDSVTAEWMERMTKDTTFAISKVYGDAFTNPNIGKFAQSGSAQVSSGNLAIEKIKNDFDLYIKVMCHQNMAAMKGLDAATVLNGYGLSAGDWSMVSGHWAPQMGSNLDIAMQMSDLMTKYNAEFA